jgi:hypothetical protein
MRELLDIAILAYRTQRYTDAIDFLADMVAKEPGNWMATLYLGLSYEKSGKLVEASRLFWKMSHCCTDADLKQQAQLALILVESEMKIQSQSQRTTAPNSANGPSYADVEAWMTCVAAAKRRDAFAERRTREMSRLAAQ